MQQVAQVGCRPMRRGDRQQHVRDYKGIARNDDSEKFFASLAVTVNRGSSDTGDAHFCFFVCERTSLGMMVG